MRNRFFVSTNHNDETRFYLVSNKHVFDNKKSLFLKLKEKSSGDYKSFEICLVDPASENVLYYLHDVDDVDLAVLPINQAFIDHFDLDICAFNMDDNAMDSNDLRLKGCSEGNAVYMLGYPMGIVDEDTMLPICRMGCIAKMSEPYIAKKHFMLVDIDNFPGNSGSPIVNKPEVISIQGTPNLSESLLIGIVCGYIPYKENLKNMQTNEIVEVHTENSGIACVVPTEFLIDIIAKIK